MTNEADSPTPQQLLDAGWRARYVDAQFELAQDFFVRSFELARCQDDKRAMGHALLAIHNNAMWCNEDALVASLDYDQLCQQSLELFRGVGDEPGIAASLRASGDHAASLEIYRRIKDPRGIALCLERLMCFAANDADRTRALRDEALPIARQLDDPHVLAIVLLGVGVVSRDDDPADRRAVLLEAAEIYRKLDHLYDCSRALQVCAMLGFDDDKQALTADDRLLKARLLEDARRIRHDLGCDDLGG